MINSDHYIEASYIALKRGWNDKIRSRLEIELS